MDIFIIIGGFGLFLIISTMILMIPNGKINCIVRINAKVADVRRRPSNNSKIIGNVRQGEIIASSKFKNGWYYIDDLGGWVDGFYVDLWMTK